MENNSTTATQGRYQVKCDDCKATMGHTDSVSVSAAGGYCADCKAQHAAREAKTLAANARIPKGTEIISRTQVTADIYPGLFRDGVRVLLHVAGPRGGNNRSVMVWRDGSQTTSGRV